MENIKLNLSTVPPASLEPSEGPEFNTLRSRPEFRSKVKTPKPGATRAPLETLTWYFSLMQMCYCTEDLASAARQKGKLDLSLKGKNKIIIIYIRHSDFFHRFYK